MFFVRLRETPKNLNYFLRNDLYLEVASLLMLIYLFSDGSQDSKLAQVNCEDH